MTEASVIIPARNAAETIGRTLSALADQRYDGEFEVLVVDDESTDRTREVVAAAGDERVTVLAGAGGGPAAARNLGARAASGRALAFTDADCFPGEDWLAAGLHALRSAELVQGRVLPDPEASVGPWDRTLWITFEVGLYETANLFVRREVFERVGGFEAWLDPATGAPHMGEDVLFGWQAKRLGARSAFCPGALAHHAVFARGPGGYVAERRRLRHFPAIARKVPELRNHFFWRRVFLTRRSAAFALAAASVGAAAAARNPLALAGIAPYALLQRRERGAAPAVAAVDAAADAVGLAALLWGSVEARSPLL
ncbi:MAG: glycosyltransferase family A protein [Thermoleophilaceae bacterium]